MFTRRLLLLVSAASLLLGLVGCAAVLGPRTIEVSEAQLQQHLAKRFPFSNRYLELLDITVSSPRLTLLPELNRIATELDISASDRLLRTPFKGSLALNYGLRFEPGDNTIRLDNVRVERFAIDGAPGAFHTQLSRMGALLAEQLMDNQVIHTLKPEDVQRVQGRGYQPGELKVTSRGIALTLNPIR